MAWLPGHRTCRVGFGRGFLLALDRLIGETNCRLASLTGTQLLGWGAKMKVKPLQRDSTVEFWPWGNFDLEFLASFGGLMTRASDIRKQVYRCCINFPHESSSLASAWPVNSYSLPSFPSLFTVKRLNSIRYCLLP